MQETSLHRLDFPLEVLRRKDPCWSPVRMKDCTHLVLQHKHLNKFTSKNFGKCLNCKRAGKNLPPTHFQTTHTFNITQANYFILKKVPREFPRLVEAFTQQQQSFKHALTSTKHNTSPSSIHISHAQAKRKSCVNISIYSVLISSYSKYLRKRKV